MKVNNINSPAFKKVFVTTSTKNYGDYVAQNVIDPFKKTANEIANSPYAKEFESLREDTAAFVLGAGAGSRLAKITQKQGPKVTKIGFGAPIVDENSNPTGRYIHMLDLQMALAAPLMDEEGIQRINAKDARGTFAEVYDYAKTLRLNGEKQKNVVIMCGDNLFHTEKDDPFEPLRFIKETIEDPNKIMGLFGVEREPQATVKTYGVLKVGATNKNNVMSLEGFREKPETLEKALEFATDDGKCIANTGMFVIKKEAMEWLMDNILAQEENNPDAKGFIAKSASEPYDFAAACEKIQKHYGKDKCDVKVVDIWEDAGEPATLYRTIAQWQKGYFLSCLPEKLQEQVKNSMKQVYDGTSLLVSDDAIRQFKSAKNFTNSMKNLAVENIEGVNVVSKLNISA